MASGAARAAQRFAAPAAVILTYHSVQDEPSRFANSIGLDNIHQTSVFAKHMELVAKRFNPVTLEDIVFFAAGTKRVPPKSVAVTLDDGFADNAEIAAPVLERFGIRATFYITVGSIGMPHAVWYVRLRHAFRTTREETWRDPAKGQLWPLLSDQGRDAAFLWACELGARQAGRRHAETVAAIERDLNVEPLDCPSLMMNWEQVRRLRQAGHMIGSHTLSHPNLAFVEESEAREEMEESKRRIEEELAAPAVHFSYPHPSLNPNWNDRTVAISKQLGYCSAVTTRTAPVRTGANPLCLPRLGTPEDTNDFRWRLESAFL